MSKTQSQNNSGNEQAGLSQFEYSQYEKETPDEFVQEVTEAEEIYSLAKGSQVWIDGTTYTVIGDGMHLFTGPPKFVIGEDGSQHQLIAGAIPNSDVTGVTWRNNVSSKEKSEISRSDLVAEYDDVYITYKGDDLKHFQEIIPDSATRNCPECRENKKGTIKHTEIQQNTTIEVRACTNTDCKHTYRYTQPINQDSTATLLFRDHENRRFQLKQLTGFFEVEDQDDFKFPIETHNGIHDGYRCATEIANFLNKKMVTEGINNLIQEGEFSPSDLLNLLSFTKQVSKSPVKGETTEVDINDWGEVLVQHFEDDSSIATPNEIAHLLCEITPNQFANVLYAIYSAKQLISSKESRQTDKSPQITELDLIQLAKAVSNEEPTPENEIQEQLVTAYNQTISGREFLTSTAFYDLLTETSEAYVFGKVGYDQGRYNHISKEDAGIKWADAVKEWDQKMQVTYSEFERKQQDPFSMSFHWQMDDYDLTELITP
jgi:hypothetical protein